LAFEPIHQYYGYNKIKSYFKDQSFIYSSLVPLFVANKKGRAFFGVRLTMADRIPEPAKEGLTAPPPHDPMQEDPLNLCGFT
jgi:hypothetical protein